MLNSVFSVLLQILHVDRILHPVDHPILHHSLLHVFLRGPYQVPFRIPCHPRGNFGEEGAPNPRPLPRAWVSRGGDVEMTCKGP
ncbi:uncharacterized protein N7496_004476 [Penicillium cataractarum]|uniref:Uncharacterized protein n=1 Tax=Penicillium cataractarum TaxID=2100454 RepID=A0A9W9ST87_9EURO|nr:uncharacterized protein N7496_004476 [Penicillium cataractarum]KAJ5382048.1 hypothetical protein N7496_004476 [Penicillium cataractarum]